MVPKRWWMPAALVAAVLALVLACVTNPATGRTQLILVSEEREIALGRENDPKIRAEYGVYDDDDLGAWFESVSSELASETERPDLPYRFALLDSPIVNAFALPGGPVYATRGLLAHANSEAEVAGVMGHEVGHVVARHGAEQMSQQMFASGALLGVGLLVEDARPYMAYLGAGTQLFLLRYSRRAEHEADELGVRYMHAAGWDPRGMPRFMGVLDRLSARSEGALPMWLSTHPDPGARVETTTELARPLVARAREQGRSLEVGASSFFDRVDGLVFGEDPRQGFQRGRTFHHPEMAFRFDAPEGWQIINTRRTVVVVDDTEQPSGVVQLSLVDEKQREGRTPEEYANALAAAEEGLSLEGRALEINGLTAYLGEARATSQGRTNRLLASWVEHDGQLYQFLGQWGSGAESSVRPQLERTVRSFREETDAEVLAVEPVVLDVRTLPAGRSIESYCASADDLGASCEELATINQLALRDPVETATRIKVPKRQSRLYP